MITGGFDEHARNLAAEERDTDARLKTATEIRDSIEIVHTSEYSNFLNAFFPVFSQILRHGTPQFEDCPEQKLRNVLLEILDGNAADAPDYQPYHQRLDARGQPAVDEDGAPRHPARAAQPLLDDGRG